MLALALVLLAQWPNIPAGSMPDNGSAGQCLNIVSNGTNGVYTWGSCSGGSGAPTDATYVTQTPSAGLSAEQAMSTLSTGLVLNTTGTGVQGIYPGSSCGANQYATAASAIGSLSCSQPAFSGLTGSIATSQLGFVRRVTGSNVTNSTTTPATTGLSWSVAASTEYSFACWLTSSGTATALARFNLNGPAAATTVSFVTQRFTTTAAQTLFVLQAFSAAAQTAACVSSCNTTVLPSYIYGTIINGANAGTVDLQVASSTAGQTVTVYRGSYCVVF